jgi:uncharacterized membrane protein YgcG
MWVEWVVMLVVVLVVLVVVIVVGRKAIVTPVARVIDLMMDKNFIPIANLRIDVVYASKMAVGQSIVLLNPVISLYDDRSYRGGGRGRSRGKGRGGRGRGGFSGSSTGNTSSTSSAN